MQKKNSRATTPSAKESEQTPKSHPKRKRTAGEVGGGVDFCFLCRWYEAMICHMFFYGPYSSFQESNKSEVGEEMVGKKVNIWWPFDKK